MCATQNNISVKTHEGMRSIGSSRRRSKNGILMYL